MTDRRDIFKHLRSIRAITIGLPNRSEAVVMEQGSVCVESNLIVRDVSFISNLKCNLISLGQLMDDPHYFISLSNNCSFYRTISRGCRLEWLSERMGFCLSTNGCVIFC